MIEFQDLSSVAGSATENGVTGRTRVAEDHEVCVCDHTDVVAGRDALVEDAS